MLPFPGWRRIWKHTPPKNCKKNHIAKTCIPLFWVLFFIHAVNMLAWQHKTAFICENLALTAWGLIALHNYSMHNWKLLNWQALPFAGSNLHACNFLFLSVANIFLRPPSVLAVWRQSSRHVSEDFESHWRGSSRQRCNKKSAGVCVSKLNDNQLKFKYKCFFSLFSFLFFLIGGRQKHEDQRCYQRDLHHKSCGLLVSNLGMFSVLCNMTWHLNRTVEEK